MITTELQMERKGKLNNKAAQGTTSITAHNVKHQNHVHHHILADKLQNKMRKNKTGIRNQNKTETNNTIK